MKTLTIVMVIVSACLFGAAFARNSAAADATLAWEYDQADEAKIDGFRVLYTDVNLGVDYSHTVADPSARQVENIVPTLRLVPSHKYAFTCRAYSAEGESDDSNQVEYTVPSFDPPGDTHPVVITIKAPATVTISAP